MLSPIRKEIQGLECEKSIQFVSFGVIIVVCFELWSKLEVCGQTRLCGH